jgi:hypothetical protein
MAFLHFHLRMSHGQLAPLGSKFVLGEKRRLMAGKFDRIKLDTPNSIGL